MKITLNEVKQTLLNEKYFVPEADVETAFNAINQDELYATIRGTLTVEAWDLKSDINGTPAETVLANIQLPQGSTPYLIKSNGQTVYFQWHKANVDGYQPIVDAIAEGTAHADEVATQQTVQGVMEVIKEGLKPTQQGYEEATIKSAQDFLVLELIEGGLL